MLRWIAYVNPQWTILLSSILLQYDVIVRSQGAFILKRSLTRYYPLMDTNPNFGKTCWTGCNINVRESWDATPAAKHGICNQEVDAGYQRLTVLSRSSTISLGNSPANRRVWSADSLLSVATRVSGVLFETSVLQRFACGSSVVSSFNWEFESRWFICDSIASRTSWLSRLSLRDPIREGSSEGDEVLLHRVYLADELLGYIIYGSNSWAFWSSYSLTVIASNCRFCSVVD